MSKLRASRNFYKNFTNTNPLLSNFFCADPTAVEYEGRLYVYGTNDHQQYEAENRIGKNTYSKIKSLVCFSTDDMVNWTFHGVINVEKIAPWIINSWAPSIISRKESDGLTHFYLYFSNTGYGVGVLTATNPLGPWTSPLEMSLIYEKMEGLDGVPNPFDPGVCLDEHGEGWLSFGGGIMQGRTEEASGTARIVKLGKDLISLDSDFIPIEAPYFYEASELNYINHTYVYTFDSNWVERKNWDSPVEKSTQCSMNYMVSKTPLDSKSWTYAGNYFKNPGDQGLNYSNNHTHIAQFNGQYYLLYHTLTLQEDMPTNGGFRSICADKIEIVENPDDKNPVEIKMCAGTRTGVNAIKNLDGTQEINAATIHTSAEIEFDFDADENCCGIKSVAEGSWISIKNVDFGNNASGFKIKAKNISAESAFIEVRLDKLSKDPDVVIDIAADTPDFQKFIADFEKKLSGVHDLYLVFSNSNIILKNWQICAN